MANALWDHIGQVYPWVGKDLDSQAKFKLATAKKFEMTIAEVEAAIAERFTIAEQGSGTSSDD